MSHITHLYHLSALDFINTSTFPGMPPWTPSYTASDMLVATGPLGNTGSTSNLLVQHYVEALAIRRKCHTAGALFSGRQPIQNAMVPGGVTTLYSATYPLVSTTTGPDHAGPYNATEIKSKFKSLMTDIRAFINTKYIPDVVTVANHSPFDAYWGVGAGCMNLLAYGDYPVDDAGKLLIKRGVVKTLSKYTFDQANIVEYVTGSYYNTGLVADGLHPFDGRTIPDMNDTAHTGKTGGYSWIKSPRLSFGALTDAVCEVGPLARMVNTYVSNTQVPATEGDMNLSDTLGHVLYTLGVLGSDIKLTSYNAKTLVDAALDGTVGSHGVPGLSQLYSPLGRHAARALEAKYVADAMAGSYSSITSWVDQLVPDASCYTYAKIPKQIATGYGLTEAPRGALGHWIKIEGKKVAKYQCVVPSTWNFSPMHNLSDPNTHGPVEQSLMDTVIGATPTEQIINILRVVHPFDCCIACAVHVVNPEGKETLKFAIGPDGRPTNIEVKE